jgi:two-component system chemotaxis response regulator CheB
VSAPRWLGRPGDDVLEIQLPAGAALLVLIPRAQGAVSRALVISGEQCEKLGSRDWSWKGWFESEQIAIGSSSSPTYTYRWFGNAEVARTLSPLLEALGMSAGKHLYLSIDQTASFHFVPAEGRLRIQKSDLKSQRRAKVLVVDDSETIRKLLTHVIDEDPALECVEAVESPLRVEAAIVKHQPDVITLDIHMPEMDGVTLLKRILARHTIPVVMISALSKEEGTQVLEALEVGAVDYLQKPSMSDVKSFAPQIREKIRDASKARVKKASLRLSGAMRDLRSAEMDPQQLVVIGSSTGGTEALKSVLTRLPQRIPPILIVQHIPPVFSKAFADRMAQLCPFEVREARDGDLIEPGVVLIAPGGKQMKVRERQHELRVLIDDSPPVNRHKPSVDCLFDSVAALRRKKVVACILTGMGADGARGMLALRGGGARTFAQDEATSVVFGMPKEALRLGGAEVAVPLDRIADKLVELCRVPDVAGRRVTG